MLTIVCSLTVLAMVSGFVHLFREMILRRFYRLPSGPDRVGDAVQWINR